MIRTRALTPADTRWLAEGTALLNQSQGVGLFGEYYLRDFAARNDACVFAATEGDALVAVAVTELLTRLDYFLPFRAALAEELAGKCVASFTTLSVAESWRGRGIGQELSHLRLAWLRDRRCDTVLGVSWESGLAHTSNRTFEKCGFQPVARLADFYVNSSLEKPFDCPGCRALPCTCGAILYRLDL